MKKTIITASVLSLFSILTVSAYTGVQAAVSYAEGVSPSPRAAFTEQEISLVAKYLKAPTDYVHTLIRKNGTVFVSALLGSAKVLAMSENGPTQPPVVMGASIVDNVVQKIQSCTNITRNIHRGDESLSTKKLQNFLLTRGLLNEKVSGFYGDKTIEAVKAYQGLVGIPVTGMVYDMTRQAIKAETCN